MAQGEVAQAYVFEQLQGVGYGGHGFEKAHGFVYFHFEHIAYAFAAPSDSQGFGVEPGAVAGFAGYFYIGQETHFDGS